MRLSRQLALAALKFSANARDVHFLRSLGRRAVGEAAELHDAGVSRCLAVILGQASLPEPDVDGVVQPLCERPATDASESFQTVDCKYQSIGQAFAS